VPRKKNMMRVKEYYLLGRKPRLEKGWEEKLGATSVKTTWKNPNAPTRTKKEHGGSGEGLKASPRKENEKWSGKLNCKVSGPLEAGTRRKNIKPTL